MCGWSRPPTPSIPLGSRMPCQWMEVCSGSRFVTRMRTRSPSTASIVGPGVRAVVAPAVDGHAGRELLPDRLRGQMELLDAALHHEGKRGAVRSDDRLVGEAGAARRRRGRGPSGPIRGRLRRVLRVVVGLGASRRREDGGEAIEERGPTRGQRSPGQDPASSDHAHLPSRPAAVATFGSAGSDPPSARSSRARAIQ